MIDDGSTPMRAASAPPVASDREEIRVRFAPNGEIPFPGFIVRTVLYAWLFARRFDGRFVLRLDDTDVDRQAPGGLQSYPDGLRWLGLAWDEGPEVGGPFGPYRQSERLHLYRDAVDRLLESGHAYRCYCSPKRLARVARAARQPGAQHRAYDGRCRHAYRADVEAAQREGRAPAIRLRVPDSGDIVSHDLLRGPVIVSVEQLSDFVICRPDGWATYHLTVVVDDFSMRISHVIRGIEGLSNMAPQALVHRALGVDPPFYLHHPLVRTRGFAITEQFLPQGHLVYLDELRAAGIPREAILAYYGQLGYSAVGGTPTLDEQIADFDYRRISRKDFVDQSLPALLRTGEKYLRSQAARPLVRARVTRRLVAAGLDEPDANEMAERATPVLQRRVRRMEEIDALLWFAARKPEPQQVDARTAEWLGVATQAVEAGGDPKAAIRALSDREGLDLGEMNRSLLALLGAAGTPLSLNECVAILGREATLKRWNAHAG